MTEFKIKEKGFDEIKKRVIVTMAILFTGVLIIVVLIPALMSDDPTRMTTLPFMVVIMLGVGLFSVTNGIKKQRPIFESFVLKIDDEKITREKMNTPPLVIYNNDITKITKASNGAFRIDGKDKLNPISVPAQIDNREQLETLLSALKPLTIYSKKTFLEKMFIPISLSGAVLMGITFVSKNEPLVMICSILVVLMLAGSLVLMQLNKNIDSRTKKLSWFVLLPLASFVFRIMMAF